MSLRGRAASLIAVTLFVATACQAEPIEVNPGLAIARINEVPTDGVLYSIEHDIYLADAGEDGFVALSRRDPYLGCTVQSLEPGDDFGITLHPSTRFVDPSHGGQYDIAGRYLAGPAGEGLRRLPIEVIAGTVYLDPNPERDV